MSGITRLPISTWQRERNRIGKRGVIDEIYGRHLKFGSPSAKTACGHLVNVSVMSAPNEEAGRASRRLCELWLPVEELRRIVDLLEEEALAADGLT